MEIFGSTSLKTRLKARVEAILFLAENPMSATEIAQRTNADLNDIRESLVQLVQEYEARDGGLMIDTSRGYFMQIQEEFEDLTDQILPIQLKTGCIRTLSVIALQEPIYQADLVQKRGGGAYEQIKDLVSMNLVKKRKEGNRNVLTTTKLFDEYFKLSQNGIELQDVLKDKKKSKKVEFSRKRYIEEEELPTEETDEEASSDDAITTEAIETDAVTEVENTAETESTVEEAVELEQETGEAQVEASAEEENLVTETIVEALEETKLEQSETSEENQTESPEPQTEITEKMAGLVNSELEILISQDRTKEESPKQEEEASTSSVIGKMFETIEKAASPAEIHEDNLEKIEDVEPEAFENN